MCLEEDCRAVICSAGISNQCKQTSCNHGSGSDPDIQYRTFTGFSHSSDVLGLPLKNVPLPRFTMNLVAQESEALSGESELMY